MNNVPFLNLEYFYKLIYDFLRNASPLLEWPPQPGSGFWWFALFLMAAELALTAGIAILLFKIMALRRQEMGKMRAVEEEALVAETSRPKNERWEKVLKYLAAENPAEWKLAIIEADNILDELVEKFPSAKGDNLGERLKSIEPSDFTTLNDAWEAHKVRNRIAHESNFVLTQRGAKETIERYRRVFEEFDYLA